MTDTLRRLFFVAVALFVLMGVGIARGATFAAHFTPMDVGQASGYALYACTVGDATTCANPCAGIECPAWPQVARLDTAACPTAPCTLPFTLPDADAGTVAVYRVFVTAFNSTQESAASNTLDVTLTGPPTTTSTLEATTTSTSVATTSSTVLPTTTSTSTTTTTVLSGAACTIPRAFPPDGGTLVSTTAGLGDTLHGSCAKTTGGEVVYTWTPSRSGPWILQTCGSAFDTVLYVRDGACATEVACNDDTSGCDTNQLGHGSSVKLNAVAGVTYTIVVDGYSGAAGTYQLKLIAPPTTTSSTSSTTTSSSTSTSSTSSTTSTTLPAPRLDSIGGVV